MINLFLSFFKVGILGFGGGSAVAPLIHKECVEKHKWVTDDEFIDIVAIANSLPGPSMSQIAAAIGYKKFGIIGSLISTISIIIPMCIVFILSMNFLFNFLGQDFITTLTKPVLIVVSALMISLSRKFYLKSILKIKKYIIYMIVSIVFLLIIIYNIHPSIFIIIMISYILIFTKEKNVN